MQNCHQFQRSVVQLADRLIDPGAFREEIHGVTTSLQNRHSYFNHNDGQDRDLYSRAPVHDTTAVGIVIPGDGQRNSRGYVFGREKSGNEPVSYFSVMRFEYTPSDDNVFQGVHSNLPYNTECVTRRDDEIQEKCDFYHELLRPFSETPVSDVQKLLDTYRPPTETTATDF